MHSGLMSIVKKCHGAILTLFEIVMIVMPELKQFKLDCLLTEVERIFQRDCCPVSSPTGLTLPRLSICEALPRAPLRTFFEKKVLRTPKNF